MKKKEFQADIPVRFFTTDALKPEQNALDELENLIKVNETIAEIQIAEPDFFDEPDASLLEVAITPDFHKGSGVPIGTTMLTKGFLIPQAIGNDINCGMRMYTTSLSEDKIRENLPAIEKNIRHVFFEGGRDIAMTKINREAIFKEGLIGLFETHKNMNKKGLWKYYDASQQEQDLAHVNQMGSLITDQVIGMDDYMGGLEPTYDSQIGSIGGGNHFVEVQKVTAIHHAQIANAWNLKVGQVVVMIHTGSVSIGSQCGTHMKEVLKSIHPTSIKQPENGIYVLPKSEKFNMQWEMCRALLNNAGNFAFANRLFLGMMIYKALADQVNEFDFKLLYDAPHNFIWDENIDQKDSFIHRKGSCTAKSAEQMQNTPFGAYGEPVLIPGSMGAKSFILSGLGNRESLFSASHGAGRKLSRGKSLKVDDQLFRDFMGKFNVITPIDPKRQDIRSRVDILTKWEDELKKEAPYAYKDISPIIQTHVDHGMAQVVAEVEPILTIKG
jgi:tRNA-splicing ligase RtcB